MGPSTHVNECRQWQLGDSRDNACYGARHSCQTMFLEGAGDVGVPRYVGYLLQRVCEADERNATKVSGVNPKSGECATCCTSNRWYLQDVCSHEPFLRPDQGDSFHLPHSGRLACVRQFSSILGMMSVVRAGGLKCDFLGTLDDITVAAIVVASSDAQMGTPFRSVHASVRHFV